MGIQVYRDISVDFSNSRYIIMNAKQHDSKSRFIRMTCTNAGQKFNLNPENYSAFIRYRKPDGYGVFNKCVISNRGQIIFELTEQMLSTVGTSCADLIILDVSRSDINNDLTIISADGKIIENNNFIVSTMNFYINVLKKPINCSEIESTNEFCALNELLQKANTDYEYLSNVVMEQTQEYMENTLDAKNSAAQYAADALISKNSAAQSALNAKQSENNTKRIEESTTDKMIATYNSALLAKSYTSGDSSGLLSDESWNEIVTSSDDYIPVETRTNEDIDNAKYYCEQAKKYADSYSSAELAVDTVLSKAIEASNSASAASNKAIEALDYALTAKSYSEGNTGKRENENTDNAKYYYEQAKLINEALNGDFVEKINNTVNSIINTIDELKTRVENLENILKNNDILVVTDSK